MIIETLNNKNMSKKSKDGKDYDDSGLKLINKPNIYIPRYLDDLMYDINENKDVEESAEFSIFVVSKIKGFNITLTPEYYIPKQRVHSTEVEYDEPRPDNRFNTVIHRHPDSMPTSFSGGDNEYINRNFDISILWTEKGSFGYGQYNMYHQRRRLVIPCELFVIRPDIQIKGLNKIKKYVYKQTKYYQIENDDTPATNGDIRDKDFYNKDNWKWDYTTGGWLYKGVPQTRYTQQSNALAHVTDQPNLFPPKRDSLSGSVIGDGYGNLLEYDEVFGGDWVEEATIFFEQLYDDKDCKVAELALEMTQILDEIKPNYTRTQSEDAGRFWNLMGIIAHCYRYHQWESKYALDFARSKAKQWLNDEQKDVEYRVKKMYEYVVNKEAKEVTQD